MKSMPSVPGPTWCQGTKEGSVEARVMVRERGPRVKRPAHSTARERWLPGFSASFAPSSTQASPRLFPNPPCHFLILAWQDR